VETTEGTLLGGRLRYRQPQDGYRTGIEPVLLAASVPARPGDRVVEAGTGAGAGLLCLAARVGGIRGTGVEIDPEMAELARVNCAANGFAGLTIRTGDVMSFALPEADHVLANPPWFDERSTASPVARRRRAKQEAPGGLEQWIAAMAGALVPDGSLTLIVPTPLVGRAIAACETVGLELARHHALLPKRGREAKLNVLQARRGAARLVTTCTVLHEECGAFTPAVEAVLREGAALG